MIENFFWNIFEQSGNIDAYLAYKASNSYDLAVENDFYYSGDNFYAAEPYSYIEYKEQCGGEID